MLNWHPTPASPASPSSRPAAPRHPRRRRLPRLPRRARPGPLGFNALQLSTDRDPNAIHGEPLAPGMTTLATLDARAPACRRRGPSSWPIRRGSAPSDPRTRAVLGYFAANCGTCHNRGGDIAYAGPSLKHSDVADGDAVAAALLAQADGVAGARPARGRELHAQSRPARRERDAGAHEVPPPLLADAAARHEPA